MVSLSCLVELTPSGGGVVSWMFVEVCVRTPVNDTLLFLHAVPAIRSEILLSVAVIGLAFARPKSLQTKDTVTIARSILRYGLRSDS